MIKLFFFIARGLRTDVKKKKILREEGVFR